MASVTAAIVSLALSTGTERVPTHDVRTKRYETPLLH